MYVCGYFFGDKNDIIIDIFLHYFVHMVGMYIYFGLKLYQLKIIFCFNARVHTCGRMVFCQYLIVVGMAGNLMEVSLMAELYYLTDCGKYSNIYFWFVYYKFDFGFFFLVYKLIKHFHLKSF